jgi:fructose-1,6-bisphosphatase/inositol monophosphatase family enzyme
MKEATMTQDFSTLLDPLVECARLVRAAVAAAEYNRLAEVVGLGADGFDTSRVDQVAESAALNAIEAMQPRMNILSEEVGYIDRGSALTAIVDPIDATHNATSLPSFLDRPDRIEREIASESLPERHVYGFPYYGFSVGVRLDDGIVAGCVMNLPTGVVFTGARGNGVQVDGVPVAHNSVQDLARARIAFVRPRTEAGLAAMHPLLFGAHSVRITGCSSIDLALMSCGTLHGLVNPHRELPHGWGEKVVDYAGALALLEEAGGVLTDFEGQPVPIGNDLSVRCALVAGATPELHATLLRELHGALDAKRR